MEILNAYTRVFTDSKDLEKTIYFYEQLFNKPCHLQFEYPEYRLELAAVGAVLIIAGGKQDREPFEATHMTLVVEDLMAFKDFLILQNASILQQPTETPTGVKMRARHPDGMVVEYVEQH